MDWNKLIGDNFPLILNTILGLFSLFVTIWTVYSSKNQDLKKIKLDRKLPKIDLLYDLIQKSVDSLGDLVSRDSNNILTINPQNYIKFDEGVRNLQNKLLGHGIYDNSIKISIKNLRLIIESYSPRQQLSSNQLEDFYYKLGKSLKNLNSSLIKLEDKMYK